MSQKSWLPLSVLAAAIAAGAWWWTRPATPSASDAGSAGAPAASAASGAASGSTPRVQAVSVFAARQQDVPVQLEASGTVAPLKTVDIRAQITGTVQEVLVRDGQDVKAGQVLFRFDDRADRANLDKAKAQLVRDRATLADQLRQLQRAQELKAQGFFAQSAVDAAQTQVDAQQALIASDVAAQKAAEVSLSYSTVRAPLNGRAGLLGVTTPGSLVQPAATAAPLVSISQIDPIGVVFTLPEAQLGALMQAAGGARRAAGAPGTAASGSGKAAAAGPAGAASAPRSAPPANAGASAAARPASGAGGGAAGLRAFVSMPGARGPADAAPPLEGRVTFIDNAVDSTTGTIRARAEFANADRQLWPGQYVRLKLTLRTVKDAVVIPQAALIIRGQERSVYVVGDDNTAQLRPVQTRQPLGELIVVEGLQAGEKVVLDGKQNLRPGTPVKAVPAQLDPAGGRRRGPADAASGAGAGASAAGPATADGASGAGASTAASGAASGARP